MERRNINGFDGDTYKRFFGEERYNRKIDKEDEDRPREETRKLTKRSNIIAIAALVVSIISLFK